jgi:hypothetical protein
MLCSKQFVDDADAEERTEASRDEHSRQDGAHVFDVIGQACGEYTAQRQADQIRADDC